jgi:hypothetical protein
MKKQLMRFVKTTLFSKLFRKATAIAILSSFTYAETKSSPASYKIVNIDAGVGKNGYKSHCE